MRRRLLAPAVALVAAVTMMFGVSAAGFADELMFEDDALNAAGPVEGVSLTAASVDEGDDASGAALTAQSVTAVRAKHKSTVSLRPGKNNTKYLVFGDSAPRKGFYVYVKIRPMRTGCITFKMAGSGRTQLLNSSKRVLTSRSSLDTYNNVCYGVAKGRTYYIKLFVDSARYDYDVGYYGAVYYAAHSYTGKFGTSQSRASKLRRNTYRKGYILSTGKPGQKAKYYKVHTGSRSRVTINCYTNSSLRVKIIQQAGGGTKSYNYKLSRSYPSHHWTAWTTAKSQTLYFKVYRTGKYSSGAYSIKAT